MKPLFNNIQELKARADEYLQNNTIVAPRSFRMHMGISKYALSMWKKTNPDFFNLIKTYEDAILAKIEEYAIYGSAHPDIKKHFTIATYDKDGNVIKEEVKFNQVGAMFTLRAYDKQQYVPEIAIQMNKENATEAKLIEIITPKKVAKKGVQSDRPIKLLKRPQE